MNVGGYQHRLRLLLAFASLSLLLAVVNSDNSTDSKSASPGRRLITTWPYAGAVPAPWGWYNAQFYSDATNTLPDATGNGNDAITAGNVQYNTNSGDGAAASIAYIAGDTTGTIAWPAGSIGATFTICSVSRYTQAAGANFRILQGKTTNWIHGHWSNRRGVGTYAAYFAIWTAQSTAHETAKLAAVPSTHTPTHFETVSAPDTTADEAAVCAPNDTAIDASIVPAQQLPIYAAVYPALEAAHGATEREAQRQSLDAA